MGNKEKVDKLMYELQQCILEMNEWKALNYEDDIKIMKDKCLKIRQEVLDLVKD